jgi:hypothetical protein
MIEYQCWICPKCHDDHSQDGPCRLERDDFFMPHESDLSYIAREYRKRVSELTALRQENERLKKERDGARAALEDRDLMHEQAMQMAHARYLASETHRFQLTGALQAIERRAGSASKQSALTDALQCAEWARNTLASQPPNDVAAVLEEVEYCLDNLNLSVRGKKALASLRKLREGKWANKT